MNMQLRILNGLAFGFIAIASAHADSQPVPPVYGPGMMHHGMMGPGWGQQLTPEQRQHMWQYMQRQGMGPGMMMGPGWGQQLTPEQRQQMWQYMHQQPGYGPGMMGPGAGQAMTPEQYKKWWDEMHGPRPSR